MGEIATMVIRKAMEEETDEMMLDEVEGNVR